MSHVDDDVVTLVPLSQSDPELRIINQRHVVLQHLWIKGHTCQSNTLTTPVGGDGGLAPPPHLCGGGILLQDVNHSLEAER